MLISPCISCRIDTCTILPSVGRYATQHEENHEDSTDINSVQAAIHPLQEHIKFRQPDKLVKAIKGHALLMETDGLRLTAIDTAVIQSETYSVTFFSSRRRHTR